MPNCMEQVYSEEYYDFLIPYGVEAEVPSTPGMRAAHRGGLRHFFLPARGTAAAFYRELYLHGDTKMLRTARYDGARCIGNHPAAESAGACVKRRRGPGGHHRYRRRLHKPAVPVFGRQQQNPAVWDQTVQDGTPPEGILYGGRVPPKRRIDEALQAERPYDVVPSRDENGHGTFVTGVVCGGEDIPNGFIGAVPNAGIAVVKLKEAKRYLREFFFVPEGVPAYQETDLMMAVSYLNDVANVLNMPLVICLALGNSMGGHGTDGPAVQFPDYISSQAETLDCDGNGKRGEHQAPLSGGAPP